MTWIQITTKPIFEPECLSGLEEFIDQYPFGEDIFNAHDHEHKVESIRIKLLAGIAARFSSKNQLWLRVVVNVVADLCNQKWILKIENGHVFGKRPDDLDSREDLRNRFVSRRNQQLREKSVQQFIADMEKWRIFNGERVSILSLMTDGRELLKRLSTENSDAIKPYIQFVVADQRCSYTGLKLQDVWRYFRHTWANPYESIPGRSMLMIVRDAATKFHSVIGISALSSAAVRLGARDKYIGWDTEQVIKDYCENPTDEKSEWVKATLQRALNGIYLVDFIRDGILTATPTECITQETILTLRQLATQQKESHHRLMEGGEYKAEKTAQKNNDEDWEKQSKTPLFRFKRALELANILEIWLFVENAYSGLSGKNRLINLVSTESGRNTLSKIIRIARSMTVGTEIADLTLCGAVAPYNHLAAFKLVAMLSVSPEAVCGYRSRYQDVSSIIASSMAGRKVFRPANLVYIGTTSLYGKRPNQYDRISFPSKIVGGIDNRQIKYDFIPDSQKGSESKTTKGVGTFHFGPNTLSAMGEYSISINSGWKVNNVFGEGASPKLRALRQGLENVGFNAEELLVHGIGKCIYGVNLTTNTARYLLGLEATPAYLYDLSAPDVSTKKVSEWWFIRWVSKRVERDDVLEKIRNETLVHPIRHHAKVIMPMEEKDQVDLF